MKNRRWFVTMQQQEIEAFNNPFERLTYEAIKSFCSNGKNEREASNHEIAIRANISKMTVGRYLPRLIDKGFVKIVGETTRVGGIVKMYKVFPEIVMSVTGGDTSSKKSVTPRSQSVTPSDESVTGVGIKLSNIKSNNKSSKEMSLDLAQKIFAELGGGST